MADQPFKIVGIAGSLRKASWNRGLLRAAVEGRPDGIEIVTLDLDLVPPYNQDVEDAGDPSSVIALKDVIRLADALLIATPEYNNGMPGVLKNAIDWASRPAAASVLRDKPVVVMGVSPGAGAAARAQQQVRDAVVYTGAASAGARAAGRCRHRQVRRCRQRHRSRAPCAGRGHGDGAQRLGSADPDARGTGGLNVIRRLAPRLAQR